MVIVLMSLFTDHLVRHDAAMTGQISLYGLALPVAGIMCDGKIFHKNLYQ